MVATDLAKAVSCPPPDGLTLEDWDVGHGTVELSCLNPRGTHDVTIHGTPLLHGCEPYRDGEDGWTSYGRVEFSAFRLSKIVWHDCDTGDARLETLAADMPKSHRIAWEVEAEGLIDDHPNVRDSIEERQCGEIC